MKTKKSSVKGGELKGRELKDRERSRPRSGGGSHWRADALDTSPGGGRGGKRLFNQGDLRLIVLRLIAEKPRHGYEVIKAIEEISLGVYSPSAGVIYPTLNYLEEMGYVTVSSLESGKKVHAITASGKSHFQRNADLVAGIDARLGGLRRFSDDAQVQQVRRAMDNLKAALRLQLTGEKISEEKLHKIVDAIDAAAKAVERS